MLPKVINPADWFFYDPDQFMPTPRAGFAGTESYEAPESLTV
jgi:hypothetical protein